MEAIPEYEQHGEEEEKAENPDVQVHQKKNSSAVVPSPFALPPEVVDRICRHMNEDHAVTVYAMAQRAIMIQSKQNKALRQTWKITQAELTSIDSISCTLTVVLCQVGRGQAGLCQRLKTRCPMPPPLPVTDVAQLRPKFVAWHHQLMEPTLGLWIRTQPVIWAILAFLISVTTVVLVVGEKGMTDAMERHRETLSSLLFLYGRVVWPEGLSQLMSRSVMLAFYATVLGHAVEAVVTLYHCQRTLKMNTKATLMWTTASFILGFPILVELLKLVNIDRASRGPKKNE